MASTTVGQGRTLLLGGLFTLAIIGFLHESPTLFESRSRWTEVTSGETLEARRLQLQLKVRRASAQLRSQEDNINEGWVKENLNTSINLSIYVHTFVCVRGTADHDHV